MVSSKSRRQGIFWMLTIPAHEFTPYLPRQCNWIRGQLECAESGFVHWQLLVAFQSKVSLKQVRDLFGPFHGELSRSGAAADYVWKDATRVAGTPFELGCKPISISSKTDWEEVWKSASAGSIESIPPGIRVRSYHALRAIRADYQRPQPMVRECFLFWGPTGTGKSYRAWEAAGNEAYSKDPRSKFWCGYGGQEHVIIDEFRGGIDVAHLLRWLDRYPVHVELKGSSLPLSARKIWITSNLDPREWYPDLDRMTYDALIRRLNIEYFPDAFLPQI